MNGRPPSIRERGAPEPRRVPGLPPVERAAIGAYFGCAIVEGGDVWCWGQNDRGQLGRGTVMPVELAPAPVTWPG